MQPDDVKQIVGDTPHMTLEQGRQITDFIRAHNCKEVLELGFSRGVSTCYIAAAVEGAGGGTVTTIDREQARHHKPNIEQLLAQCAFKNVQVNVFFEPDSYNWRLYKFLEQEDPPRFDLCYIDGAHSWAVDGLAFFLVDRLLKTGGWIIFDDLGWTFADFLKTVPPEHSGFILEMPVEERETAQVNKVFELLVKTHPCYSDFRTIENWAFAHKVSDSMINPRQIHREYVYPPPSVKNFFRAVNQAAVRRIRR